MIAKKKSRFDFESRTEHETTACTYTPYMGQMGPPRIPNLYYDSVENRLPGTFTNVYNVMGNESLPHTYIRSNRCTRAATRGVVCECVPGSFGRR